MLWREAPAPMWSGETNIKLYMITILLKKIGVGILLIIKDIKNLYVGKER